jgi:hypothetical protein
MCHSCRCLCGLLGTPMGAVLYEEGPCVLCSTKGVPTVPDIRFWTGPSLRTLARYWRLLSATIATLDVPEALDSSYLRIQRWQTKWCPCSTPSTGER